MKTTNNSLPMLIMIGMLIFSISCQDDGVGDRVLEIGDFETESFENLTVEEFSALEKPFEGLLDAASGGRTASDSTTEQLIVVLEELLEGAILLELDEGEERGLDVYVIRFLLANEATLEVVVVKEVYEILEIEGHSGPFDYDLDPAGSFISLAEAFAIAHANFDGEVIRWELELEEDNQWEYEVHVKNANGRFEIEIDAFTGDVLAINAVDETDDDEFEKEERDDELPQNIVDTVTAMIDARIIHAEREDDHDRIVWDILVETDEEALVFLEISEDTQELVYAEGEDGPFNYDLVIGDDFVGLLETIEFVEDELQAETQYWYFEQIEHDEAEVWAFIIKVKDPATDKYYRVTVDAMSGEWLEFEDFGADDPVDLPENIVEAVEAIIDGEIVHVDFEEDGDKITWYIYVKTASGAEVKLVITEDTEDLIFAKDAHGPFDYELTTGEGFITLQDALSDVEQELQAETQYWYFEQIELEGVEYWVFTIKVKDSNDVYFKVIIDAMTGNWLSEEVVD